MTDVKDLVKPADGSEPIAAIDKESSTEETPEQKAERKKKSKADRKMHSDHQFSAKPCDSEQEEQAFLEMLSKQGETVNDYWRQKYEKDAKRNWDLFYKSHEADFFKD